MTLQNTALDLINENGSTLTLARKTGAAVDPVTGIRAGSTVTTLTTKAVEIDDQSLISRTFGTINAGDKILMLHSGIEPHLADIATFDGREMVVHDIRKKSAQDLVMYYYIRLIA